MKLLLILLVVLLLAWLWRGNRRAAPPSPRRKPQPTPQDVVACAFCGLHLPVAEAVPGVRGVYCCLDHRRQREA